MSSTLSYHVFRFLRLLVACVSTSTTSHPCTTPLQYIATDARAAVLFFSISSAAGSVFGFNLRGSCPAHDHTHTTTYSRTNTITRTHTHTYTRRSGCRAKVRFGNTNTGGQRISCATVESDRGSCLTRSLYRLKLGNVLFAPYNLHPPPTFHRPARLLNINDKRKHAVTVQDFELILLLSVSGNVLLTSAAERGKAFTATTRK